MNAFARNDEGAPSGEAFRLDPAASKRVVDKFEAIRARRDNLAVERTLSRLPTAAENDRENLLLPYLVDCAHAYATVGETVERLKSRWGNFQDPVGL